MKANTSAFIIGILLFSAALFSNSYIRASYASPTLDTQKLIAWLQSNQNADGGWGYIPGESSHIGATAAAVDALHMLGVNPLNPQGAIQFERGLQNPDGGFVDPYIGGGSHIAGTWAALLALTDLGSMPANLQGAIDFVVQCGRSDGSFTHYPGATAQYPVENTLHGVDTLRMLGSLESIDRSATINWLLALESPEGGFYNVYFSSRYGPNTDSTYFAVQALAYLSSGPVDAQKTVEYIRSLENPEGSYSFDVWKSKTDIGTTAQALLILRLLGAQSLHPARTITYLASTQNADGGFAYVPGDVSRVDSSWLAVLAVQALKVVAKIDIKPGSYPNSINLGSKGVVPVAVIYCYSSVPST